MKKYRIGDFAKYLGVTPDLLKYYEEMGIIQSHRSESGYRFYQFSTVPALLESIRLRNYGMTLRDISYVLSGSMPSDFSMSEYLERDMKLLEEEIALDQVLIDDYQRFKRWEENFQDKDFDWYIMQSPEYYFLPHTEGTEFLKDARIYEILKDWMEVIPITKSALYIHPCEDGDIRSDSSSPSATWGFLIEKKYLDSLHLPLNDVVLHIPPRKTLFYQFKMAPVSRAEERSDNPEHPAFKLLYSMNLKPADCFFRVHLMPAEWTSGLLAQHGFYAIPIE